MKKLIVLLVLLAAQPCLAASECEDNCGLRYAGVEYHQCIEKCRAEQPRCCVREETCTPGATDEMCASIGGMMVDKPCGEICGRSAANDRRQAGNGIEHSKTKGEQP